MTGITPARPEVLARLRSHIVEGDDQPRVVEIGQHRRRDVDALEAVLRHRRESAGTDRGQELDSSDRFPWTRITRPLPNDATG